MRTWVRIREDIMTFHLAIARAAQQVPKKTALRGPGFDRSWAETGERIARLAAGLARQGLSQGDAIAIHASNSAEHFEITHAAIWAGIVVVPLNTRLSAAEKAEILQDSGARTIVFDEGSEEEVLHFTQAMNVTRLSLSEPHFRQLLDTAPAPAAPTCGDNLLGLYYTGGTTGRPKGVELTHHTFHLTALDQAVGMECGLETVYLQASPIFHLAGFTTGNGVTYRNGTHVFHADLSPAGILASIETYGVNFLMLVPTMFHGLLDTFGVDHPLLARVNNVVYGAAPASEALLERMITAFPQARIKQAYGQTEIGGACVIHPAEAHVMGGPKLRRTGRATLSSHIRIVGPDGQEVPRGTVGELVVAGPRIMRGYRNMPEITARTIVNGWLHTGDLAYMDEDGYIAVVDRLKEMIVTGGENVFCGEVENVLSQHPHVSAVAIVGVPDEKWGEAVHAFIVPRPGTKPDVQHLLQSARTHLAGYKVPKGVTLLEQLPLSSVGKVRKNLLRELWVNAAKA
jgi:long-chain acyl-CoA synthetase